MHDLRPLDSSVGPFPPGARGRAEGDGSNERYGARPTPPRSGSGFGRPRRPGPQARCACAQKFAIALRPEPPHRGRPSWRRAAAAPKTVRSSVSTICAGELIGPRSLARAAD